MGDAKRERVAWQQPGIGPWHATVQITPIRLGDRTEFEIAAAWHGPPQQGFPPDPRPGDRTDTFSIGDYKLARQVAQRVVDQLRAGATWPDGRAKVDIRQAFRETTGRPHGTLILPGRGTAIDPIAGPPNQPES